METAYAALWSGRGGPLKGPCLGDVAVAWDGLSASMGIQA